MTKVPPLNFRREDIPDLSTGERTDRLLRGLNAFGSAVGKLLNGGLGLSAFQGATRDVTFTEPEELRVKNDLPVTPKGIIVLHALDITGGGTETPASLANPAWRMSKDGLVVIESFGNAVTAHKYRVTIRMLGE